MEFTHEKSATGLHRLRLVLHRPVADSRRGGRCAVAGKLHHYVVPRAGRWLVVYRMPGTDAWEQPVIDCPNQAIAQAEADRLNGGAA